MLVVAFASIAIVDTQQKRTREQRERESSLNLVEGVLYAQGFQLARSWPGTVGSRAHPGGRRPPPPPAVRRPRRCSRTPTTSTRAPRRRGRPGARQRGSAGVVLRADLGDAAQSGTNRLTDRDTRVPPLVAGTPTATAAVGVGRAIVRGAAQRRGDTQARAPRRVHPAGGRDRGRDRHRQQRQPGQDLRRRVERRRALQPSSDGCVSDPGGIQPAGDAGQPAEPDDAAAARALQAARERRRQVLRRLREHPAPAAGTNLSGPVVFVDNCTNGGRLGSRPCAQPLPPQPAGGGNGLSRPCINPTRASAA